MLLAAFSQSSSRKDDNNRPASLQKLHPGGGGGLRTRDGSEGCYWRGRRVVIHLWGYNAKAKGRPLLVEEMKAFKGDSEAAFERMTAGMREKSCTSPLK